MSVIPLYSAASGVIEAPDLWRKRLSAAHADLCPRTVETKDGLAWCAADRVGPALDLNVRAPHSADLSQAELSWLATAEGRRWLQDRDQVGGEALYSTNPVWDLIANSGNDDFIVACTRAYNDWLAELCAADPERFIGVAKIPTTGIDDAVAELRRAVEDLGLRGIMLDAWPAGADTPPAAGECAGFWEAAASLGAPISIYRPLNGGKESPYAIAGGTAPEFYQDLTTIIYANIPDKNPKIRFVSVNPAVGWAPPAFEALNESYMRTSGLRKVNLGDPDLYPSDYLRRFCTFVTQDDRTALFNREYFGAAHLAWGSFAFMGVDSVWPNTRQLFERLTAELPGAWRANLASDVFRRLYRIGGAKPFSAKENNAYSSFALL